LGISRRAYFIATYLLYTDNVRKRKRVNFFSFFSFFGLFARFFFSLLSGWPPLSRSHALIHVAFNSDTRIHFALRLQNYSLRARNYIIRRFGEEDEEEGEGEGRGLAQPFLGTERTVIPYSDFDQNLNAIQKADQDRTARYRDVTNNIELVFLSFLTFDITQNGPNMSFPLSVLLYMYHLLVQS